MAKEKAPEANAVAVRFGSVRDYLVGVYNEMKKVTWPTRQQLIAYTGVVLATVIIFGVILWLFDSTLSILLEKLFAAFGKAGASN